MMEKTLGKPIPVSLVKRAQYVLLVINQSNKLTFLNSESTTKYFTSQGTLNWPQIATSRSSVDFVAKLLSIEQLCGKGMNPEMDQFYDLVMKLLRYEPEERLTAAEALSEEFFRECSNKDNTSNSNNNNS
jgi:serine/threonine protein kinase